MTLLDNETHFFIHGNILTIDKNLRKLRMFLQTSDITNNCFVELEKGKWKVIPPPDDLKHSTLKDSLFYRFVCQKISDGYKYCSLSNILYNLSLIFE